MKLFERLVNSNDDLNALGLACSYELYGRYNDNFSVE